MDIIKMDFMTPGSSDAGETLPANNSLATVAQHEAIH
jgi:alpha-galactosidase